MSSIQPVSPSSSLSDLLNAAPARASASRIPPTAGQPANATRDTPANQALLDIVRWLEQAARDPEAVLESTPTYQSIPLSRDEISAGWNSHAAPAGKT